MPIVGDLVDRPCSACGSDQVKVALATGGVIYYRCLACQHGWPEIDRRQQQSSHVFTPERRKAS